MTRSLIFCSAGIGLLVLACGGPKLGSETLETSAMAHSRTAKCVQIFYDGSKRPEKQFGYGRRMALYLQNLLGHFVHIQQVTSPIERYQKGDLNHCPYNFYLGAQFDNQLPADFLADVQSSPSSLVWLGYNVWQMNPEVFKERFGLTYDGIAEPDKNNVDPDGIPGFFRNHEYLGETFKKYAKVNNGTLEAVYDIVQTKVVHPKVKVVSWATHSTQGTRVPYITHLWNRWFVADLPFSYVNEEDRYLIFADVLFDMIDEKPLRKEKLALVRFEDVHAAIPETNIRPFFEAAKRQDAKFIVSLIPIFKDPYKAILKPGDPDVIPMTQRPSFVALLHEMQKSGVATIAMHGVTHQTDLMKNPQGVSGFDYEFWDLLTNQALANDNALDVVKRLELGYREMTKAGFIPNLWITPHYAASITDTAVFGQMFDWVAGRVIYTPYVLSQKERLPESMRMTRDSLSFEGQREKYFGDLSVDVNKGQMTEQMFPYEIYGDVLGQRILPENAAYLIPKKGVAPSVIVDKTLAILKRNRVLRDYVGSLFIHPFLLSKIQDGGFGQFDGDAREFERLFAEIKAMGYHFFSPAEWTTKERGPIRPEPREVH